jgi:hypothetical protein
MRIKRTIILLLALGMGIIIYFFIKEQFKGVTLTHDENIFLSLTYLANGILILIFARIKYLEKKNQEKAEN